jgi:chromosome segregation protein
VDVDDLIIAREKDLALENERLETGKQQQKILEQTRRELNQTHMVLAGDEAKKANILANAEQRKNALMRRLRQVDDELLLSEKDLTQARLARETIEKESIEVHAQAGELAIEKAETVQNLKKAKEERDRLRSSLKSLEIELSAHRSRYTTLKAMEDQFEWYGSGIQSLMNRLKKKGVTLVKGVLADKLRPAPGYEKAVEALLGDILQYLVVESSEHAEDLIRDLIEHNEGQCGFIALDSIEPLPEIEAPPGFTHLSSQVSCQPEDMELVRFILGNAMVADDLAQALHLRKNVRPTFPIVTRSGERVTEIGLIVGGGSQNGSSIFAKKAELAKTQAAVLEWEEKKSQLSIQVNEAESLVSQWTLKETHITERLSASEKDKTRVEKELYMACEVLRQAERKRDVLSLEQERLEGDGEDIDTDLAREKTALDRIRSDIRTHETRLKDLTDQLHTLSETLEKQAGIIVELKMDLARLKAESDNHHSSLKRLEDFLAEGEKRFARLTQEETEKKHLIRSHSAGRNIHRAEMQDLNRRLKILMEQSELCRRDVSDIEKNLKDRDAEKTHLEKLKTRERETLRVLDLELSQLKIRRENITARIEEKYHHQINQYKLEFAENEHDRIDVSTLNIPFLETELEDLNTRIIQLGDVNLGSIAEYDEIKERHDFMESQGKDLERSLADLETIIEKINDVSKERFLKTFDAINEKLATLFPTLFEGGSARMILTDPSIPLETGVELMIQPPGKKLTRLSLLSGGEKALSAIAFVFSVFLIKPASFCIMDEIDAPLDDANVTRFNNLVKHIGDQSQILVITHNKVTMEFADILFGVTMEKKGVSKIVSVSLTEAGDIEPGPVPVPASADSV